VLQLSSTVLRYLVDVKNASADPKILIPEISSTRGILSTLKETVDNSRVADETWTATIRSLEDRDGPLNVLATTFQQVATILRGLASATGIKKTVKLTSMALQAERSGEDPLGYRTPEIRVVFSCSE
jgi:hypothetical protein